MILFLAYLCLAVVQCIVSLASSLSGPVIKSFSKVDIRYFGEAFAMPKILTFYNNIYTAVYLPYRVNITLTSNFVTLEQPGPDVFLHSTYNDSH